MPDLIPAAAPAKGQTASPDASSRDEVWWWWARATTVLSTSGLITKHQPTQPRRSRHAGRVLQLPNRCSSDWCSKSVTKVGDQEAS